MIVRLGPAAETELQEAMAWYDARRVGLGLLLLDAVNASLTRIGRSPQSFASVGPGGRYRRALVARFPYKLVFEIVDEHTVRVLAVAHLRRQPGYWATRR